MICMRPIAPFGEMARTSPKLSACMTARIQAAGMPKRREASTMNAARSVAPATCRAAVGWADAGAPGMNSTADMHAAINADRMRARIDGVGHRHAGREEERRTRDGAVVTA